MVLMRSEAVPLADSSARQRASSRLGSVIGLNIRQRSCAIAKRVVDIVVSAIAIIVLAIPMCVIAASIKLDSKGPVFYLQERLGKFGKPFILIKFRSMYTDAEDSGVQWAEINDVRVTRVGRILRPFRLDEIPQFFNVLCGSMSLVGPRPERRFFYDEFKKTVPEFQERLNVTPGLSGLAQVSGGYDLQPQEKIVYDLKYIQDQSFMLDLRIIALTFTVLLSRSGAR